MSLCRWSRNRVAALAVPLLLAFPTYAQVCSKNEDLVSGFDRTQLCENPPYPTIHVLPVGLDYGKVNNIYIAPKLWWEVDCSGVWNVKEAYAWWSNSHGSAKYVHKALNPPELNGASGTVELKAQPVPDPLAKKAIQACKDNMQAEIAKGKTKEDVILTRYHLERDLAVGYASFTCYKFSRSNSITMKFDVECYPGALPSPTPTRTPTKTPTPPPTMVPGPADLGLPFAVTKASLAVNPSIYSGPCPKTLAMIGSITTNKEGTVKYRFQSSTGWKSPIAELVFAAQGTKNVAGNKEIEAPVPDPNQIILQPGNPIEGWLALEIVEPSPLVSPHAAYKVTCVKPTATPAPTALAKPADLTSVVGLTIGQKSTPWGGTLNLSMADVSQSGDGRCGYRFKYDVVNKGGSASGAFSSRLLVDDSQAHAQPGLNLAANQSTNVSGTIFIAAGQHIVSISIDDPPAVAESDETNNKFRATVNAPDCNTTR